MFRKPEANPQFPTLETEILAFWKQAKVFEQTLRGDRDFVFYDGPPFATGTPHYGHLLAGTLKDIVPRYWAMRGYRVERRFGWDTHGLPVEMEIDKQLGLSSPSEVEAYGVGRYNEACRAVVLRYTNEWRQTVERMGRWVDFDNDYKTMDPDFMESTWWVFKTLWDKGLVYRGHKVMPYSWRLGTPLSNFEAGMDYRRVQDPAVTIRFRLLPGQSLAGRALPEGAAALAWTTTPWTLPANLGLCVGPEVDYVLARPQSEPAAYLLAQALAEKVLGPHEVLAQVKGSDVVGLHYTPVFGAFADAAQEGAFRVVSDGYVTVEDGTGIVHIAPAYGEDDHRVALAHGLPLRDPVDAEGKFTGEVAPIAAGQIVGLHVKDADKLLIRDLKERGLLLAQSTIEHDYPYCWRSGTPLIYKAISTWFVKVTALRDRMAELNEQTRWVPEYVGQKRFSNWLRDARDWAISRNRFWGTPLPVWQCTGCGAYHAIGSIAELRERSGVDVHDLHKHHVDQLEIKCEACGGVMQRIPEVLDCWFESGSMPYAQNHYPFENKELVEQNLPAEFIAEGLDQTRGWFYTLLVLSTALFDRPAFRNVIVNGLILAEDGQKMSKRLKNYPDPQLIFDQYGADALRAYLVTSPAVRAEPMRFSEAGVREVVRSVVLPLWNAYSFFATYAAADGWQPPKPGGETPVRDRSLLDRWIISLLQTLIRDVNGEMEAYRLYAVIPRVLGFVDDLTNWYIRRSRRRFWRAENDADNQAAFETLYQVLTEFSRLVAPILPFMAELLYQRLEVGQREGALESVHLEPFPQGDPSQVDPELEEHMALCRTIVAQGRNLREQQKIRVRQPLPLLTVAIAGGVPGQLEDVAEIVRDELNVKAVVWKADATDLCSLSVKANFKTLGKRLGGKMKVVATGIAVLDGAALTTLQAGGSVEVEGEAIGPEDVLISQQPLEGNVVASEGRVTVALDTQITPELLLEGLAREVVSKVQAARKDAGLEVEDRIVLSLRPDSDLLRQAIARHEAMICGEVLAIALRDLDLPHADLDAAGEHLAMALQRAL
jgi:isoleucyl-tRNA synthetase